MFNAASSSAEAIADKVSLLDPSRRPLGELSDRDIAQDVLGTMHAFQEALDRAILAGLIVEPQFNKVPNRFSNVGVSAESYLVKVRILRRLT